MLKTASGARDACGHDGFLQAKLMCGLVRPSVGLHRFAHDSMWLRYSSAINSGTLEDGFRNPFSLLWGMTLVICRSGCALPTTA